MVPPQGINGFAEFSIATLSLEGSPFGDNWHLGGQLRQFTPTGADEKHLQVRQAPVEIILAAKPLAARPQADSAYRVFGTLKQLHSGYQLKLSGAVAWTPIPGSWSLAEWRYKAKRAVGELIQEHMQNRRSAAFLTGLLTGDFSDRQISSSLGRFGLQHVMAISGFHFAIVASLLGLALGTFLPHRAALITMIVTLSGYLLFLGPGASIVRAWVGAIILFMGQLLARRPRGLNSLGVALLILLLFDPTLSQAVAFQLSFLATASILLFYPWVELRLRRLFPKRSLSQVVSLSLVDQHGVIFLALLRSALALGIAVHLVMIPMTLYYFQKFPWLSLAFNLFFPFLVSISMLLLLLALPLQLFFPPLAKMIHTINSDYTQWVLNLTLFFPTSLDLFWRVSSVSTTGLVCYLSLLGIIAVGIFDSMEKKKEEREVFAFL